MTLELLQSLTALMLRTLGFVWLIRAAVVAMRRDETRVTSSAAMAAAHFLASIAAGGAA